jgi:hypothetical protein
MRLEGCCLSFKTPKNTQINTHPCIEVSRPSYLMLSCRGSSQISFWGRLISACAQVPWALGLLSLWLPVSQAGRQAGPVTGDSGLCSRQLGRGTFDQGPALTPSTQPHIYSGLVWPQHSRPFVHGGRASGRFSLVFPYPSPS